MKRTVSAMEARRRLGELLEGVYYRGDEVVIERAGKRMAVVVPAARYEAMERQRAGFHEFIKKTQQMNRDAPIEEIEAEVAAAIREVREEQRARDRANP
jgi:prevent-host-death family protein